MTLCWSPRKVLSCFLRILPWKAKVIWDFHLERTLAYQKSNKLHKKCLTFAQKKGKRCLADRLFGRWQSMGKCTLVKFPFLSTLFQCIFRHFFWWLWSLFADFLLFHRKVFTKCWLFFAPKVFGGFILITETQRYQLAVFLREQQYCGVFANFLNKMYSCRIRVTALPFQRKKESENVLLLRLVHETKNIALSSQWKWSAGLDKWSYHRAFIDCVQAHHRHMKRDRGRTTWKWNHDSLTICRCLSDVKELREHSRGTSASPIALASRRKKKLPTTKAFLAS